MGSFKIPKLAIGATESPDTYVGDMGEMTFDVGRKLASVHDNATPGGFTLLPADFVGPQDLLFYPGGNDTILTRGSVRRRFTDRPDDIERIFFESSEYQSLYGFGSTATGHESFEARVGWYPSMIIGPNSGDAWLLNPLINDYSNNLINTHLAEIDYNTIHTLRYGTARGAAGQVGGTRADGTIFGGTSRHAMMVTGISVNGGTITSAYAAAAAGTNPLFSRNFLSCFGATLYGFQDVSSAETAFGADGLNSYGFSTLYGIFSIAAFQMRNQQEFRITGSSPADNFVALRMIGATGQLFHRDGADRAALISVATPIVPHTHDTGYIGIGDRVFDGVYSRQYLIGDRLRSLSVDANGFVKSN